MSSDIWEEFEEIDARDAALAHHMEQERRRRDEEREAFRARCEEKVRRGFIDFLNEVMRK